MMKKARKLVCLLMVLCLAIGLMISPATAAHVIETETPVPTDTPAPTPEPVTPEPETPEPEPEPEATPEPIEETPPVVIIIPTPDPVTPEPITIAPVTPDPVTPEPITIAPATPEPETPEPVTPEPETPEPVTPEPVTPEPETPEPVTPEPVTPEPVTPEPETPEPVTPEPETPEPVTPEPVTPEPETPEPETPEPETPEPETPEPETPEPETPEPETPEPETPEPETPEPETPVPEPENPEQPPENPENGQEITEAPVEPEPAEPEQTEETGQEAEQPTTPPDPNGENYYNQDTIISAKTVAGGEVSDPAQYVFCLHDRPETYNISSVLISGLFYAPSGTQILRAVVTPVSHTDHAVEASDILRCKSAERLESVGSVEFTPDEERAAFAFLVDLSADDLADGEASVNVKLIPSQGPEVTLNTVVRVDRTMGQFYHVTRAISGICIAAGDYGQLVNELQHNLKERGLITEEVELPCCDENMMTLANGLLTEAGIANNTQFISAEGVGYLLNGRTATQPGTLSTEEGGFMGFLKTNVNLFGIELPMWVLIAAGAVLVLAILLVVLLLLIRKKKKAQQSMDMEGTADLTEQRAVITSRDEAESAGKILTIGDEPTMDLNSEMEAAQNNFYNTDEPTAELNMEQPQYMLKIRMIFNGQYLDMDLPMQEGQQVVIGRDSTSAIQTNPEDTSVSHKHGTLTIEQGMLRFTDNSRNGTRFNGQRLLHINETVNIPLNTKVVFDIGAHKVMMFAVQE